MSPQDAAARRAVLFALLLALTAGVSVRSVVYANHTPEKAEPDAALAAAARTAYSRATAAGYAYRFGNDQPFLPSNVATDNGEFLQPGAFPTADYCAHCHQDSHTQWRQSAHSNANRAPWYQQNVALLNAEKGVEFSRHCEGCHNPIAVVSGALTTGAPSQRPYDQDGVTCTVCHSITKVDTRGTGSYTLGVPAVLVDAQGAPITRPVSDAEILTHLDRHSAAVMRPFYKTSEFCAACHKGALPHTLNDYKWQRAFSVYDEWQNSSFAQQSPLPFYKKDTVSTCQTCHMQSEAVNGRDFGAKNGQLKSHRWLGANSLLPVYYKNPEQQRRIVAFLRNKDLNVDLFSAEQAGTTAAPLGTESFSLKPLAAVTVSVVIQNKGIAHSHVPEQRDMYESWVRFTVCDASGKVLRESGKLRPDGYLDPETHSFTNRLINVKSTLNARHEVWNNRVLAYNNTIQSGRSQIVRYSFDMPASGAVTVTAAVEYRRFDQQFIDFGMNQKHYPEPVVDMVSASRTLAVGNNDPDATPPAGVVPDGAANPLWMRWNNDGIALLDAQQYATAVAAFQHVARLRPDYADAWTNMAIVQIAWQKFTDARPNLEHALALASDDARALYYLALIERNEGHLDLAIADLEKVATQFPRSRDAHRELGFSFYQQHRYAEARSEYEAVQSVDPDDLSAHYILSILYRRLGLKVQAAEQASMFADQKDDPTASVYALNYLREHTEIASESVAWHVHDLEHKGSSIPSSALPTRFSGSQ